MNYDPDDLRTTIILDPKAYAQLLKLRGKGNMEGYNVNMTATINCAILFAFDKDFDVKKLLEKRKELTS